MTARSFVVHPRFCGPPRSANGGYVCGRLASYLKDRGGDGAVEVTLRSPPPLGKPLVISDDDDDGVRLLDGETLVAQAKTAAIEVPPPAAVDFSAATAAAIRFAGRRNHPFPTCFVCGTERTPGDALLLEPGSVGDWRVATAWRPDKSLGDGSGSVSHEFAWAALDCPGGWAAGIEGRPMVLGRMAARVLALPRVGDECVVVGQLQGIDGRKAFSSSAIYSHDGELLAHATATWLQIDPAQIVPR